jgi:hypothetical protein
MVINEKIKDLMAQVGTDISGKWMSVDHAERFVDLMIKECFEYLDDETEQKIRQHFGVY